MADFTLIDVETGALGEGAAANQRTLSELERLQHEFQTTAKQLVGQTVGSSFTAFGDMVERALPVMQKLDEQLKVGGIDNLNTLQENYESWNLTGQQAIESVTIPGIYRGSRITATRPPGLPSQVAHSLRTVGAVALNGELL